MKNKLRPKYGVTLALTIAAPLFTALAAKPMHAQSNSPIPSSLVTPNKVESRLGTLEFRDGQPNKATLEKVYDNLDFSHATRAFADTLQGVSIHALRKSLQDIGVKDNEVIVFSELMDAKSLFLTPNGDTIYFGPQQPEGVKRGNWIQTIPGKGFFPCLRLYSPLEPFFAKTWRPSEIELVK